MIPIILISGGWGLFNQFIRPNHYQLLFPYSMFMFRDDNMTGTRIGSDNKVEIKIPAGYALAGKNEKAEKLMFDEIWIDQTPVTVKEYKEFLKKGDYLAPRYHDDYRKYWDQKAYELLPVVFVSWGQAEDYCEYYGGHLPTEIQWEKAARGPEGIILYWDDAKKAFDKANYDNFFSGKTLSGWLPKGKTIYGAMDMSGNVREWAMEWIFDFEQPVFTGAWEDLLVIHEDTLGRLLKGGSYADDVSHLRLNLF